MKGGGKKTKREGDVPISGLGQSEWRAWKGEMEDKKITWNKRKTMKYGGEIIRSRAVPARGKATY